MKRLAVIVLFLVAACGSIGVQAHAVALAYKAGDMYKYSLHVTLKYTVTGSGLSIPLNLDVSAKEAVNVKSVDSGGTADLSVALTDISVKTQINGTTNTTTTTTPESLEMKVAKDGRIVSINGNMLGNTSFGGVSGLQGGLLSAILPDGAVKPGDKWSKSFDEPGPYGSGASHVTSNNTYVRDDGGDAVIESKIKGSLDITLDISQMAGSSGTPLVPTTGGTPSVNNVSIAGTSTSDVTSWIDAAGKRLVKTHSSGSVNAIMKISMAAGSSTSGLSGPVTIKGTQTLDLTPA